MSRDVSSLSTILEGPILEGSTLGARAWMKIAVLAFGLATAGCRGGRG